MSINEFVAAQLKEVNDFERELSLLLENQQEGTEQSSSAAGAQDLNNCPSISNINHDIAINNTALFLPVYAYTLPALDETNSNIQSESESALEIKKDKYGSKRSLLDAKKTQVYLSA